MEKLAQRFYDNIKDDLERNKLVLPSLPDIVPKVWAATEKPGSKADDLAQVIIKDQAISARLLAMANSVYYQRSGGAVLDVRHAIIRLGNAAIKHIVNLLGIAQLYDVKAHPLVQPHLTSLWNESTLVSSLSEVLASKMRHLSPGVALLAGLIHRIGRLPILVRAEKVRQLMEDKRILSMLMDRLQVPVGKMILEKWRLPDELVAVVTQVDDLQRDSKSLGDYVDVVQVAMLISRLGTDDPWAEVDWSTVPSVMTLGIEPEDIDGLIEYAGVRVGELRSLLRVA
ncbi:MAG: HDOD domain-containing protein [Gammaproteobacteria bacterium]|nr:HDOD domain-containing protein [Gammaproteobacteria bacterium]